MAIQAITTLKDLFYTVQASPCKKFYNKFLVSN